MLAGDRQKLLREYDNGDSAVRAELESRYGASTLRKLLQETRDLQWISENSKPCPNCGWAIEVTIFETLIHCAYAAGTTEIARLQQNALQSLRLPLLLALHAQNQHQESIRPFQ